MNGKNISVGRPASRGFTILEACVTMAIMMVVTGFAIPILRQTVNRYRLGAAVSSVTGAIRATRYQSLMEGYRYRLAINPTTNKYQLSSMIPPAATYSNVGSAIPITSNAVTISAATTLEFRPNGQVSATTGALNFNVSYKNVTQTITVTTYGNVTVN